ncbi:hypothetical protein VTO42DRAFT_6395 [Malbranchea cinnamomea]
MASIQSAIRPFGCLRSICREFKTHQPPRRFITTIYSVPKERVPFPENLPEQFKSQIPPAFQPGREKKKIPVYPPLPAPKCKDPLKAFTEDQLAILDPTGERRAMFDKKNKHGVKVGDILRVTFKNGEPFSGVCISIRSRGIDTSFLLRNKLTRLAVEMWIKVYNPNVKSVEIVQRCQRRVRRARLTYMRKPKHDMGSVENIVSQYIRNKRALEGSN